MGVNGIYGLSGSGMDIESMVKVGMMSKQNEYDKMAQKFTKNEWIKADYLKLSSQITTFNASTLSQYKLSTNMNAKNAASSNESAVKATVASSAPIMSHSVEVKGLSANAYLIGTNKMTRYAITENTANQNSTKLADVLFKNVIQETRNGNTYVRGSIAPVTAAGVDTTQLDGVSSNSTLGTLYAFGRGSETYQQELSSGDSEYNDPDAYWQKSNGNGNWVTQTGVDPSIDPGNAPTWPVYGLNYDQYLADYAAWQTQKNLYDDYTNNPNDWRKVIDRTKTVANSSIDDVAFEFTIGDGKNSGKISYKYSDLLGDNGKTLTDLANDIKQLGLNITAGYDIDRDQFTLYNKESGLKNKIEITLGGSENTSKARSALAARNFFNNLGLYQSANGKLTGEKGATNVSVGDGKSLLFDLNATESVKGDDNEIIIDGVTYKESTNKVSIGGITYTATAIGSSTVTVTQDTDAIVDKVKSFVADYNKLLSSLYEKYDEKPNSDYKPLTQSQKDAMKEEQITKWEEKAKAGLLYHDQTIGKIIQNMRSAITNGVEQEDGSTLSVFSLGISTTGLKGQLVLDEDKLKKALDKDPDIVYNVLSKPDLDVASKNGVAQKLGDIFTDAVSTIKKRAGSSSDVTEDSDLNNLLRQLQTRMSNFKKMMATYENALYKKYDAMEATLARLGTQLNFVMGGNG